MIHSSIFAKELKNKLDNYQCNTSECGIVIGDAGMILSLSKLYSYTQNDYYLDKMYDILDAVFEEEKYGLSLGYGISGLAWSISLISEELIENRDEWLIGIHQALETEYGLALEQGNLDYFKGATGLLFYFLNCPIKIDNINDIIESYLKAVQEKLSENDWFENLYDRNTGLYRKELNLGTPHGLTGIILMLLTAKEKEFDVDECIFTSLFEIMLSYEFKDREKTYCYYPSKVYEDGSRNKSGLAWCYGDLMIAYAMLKYGILYGNDYYTQYSKLILQDSLSKKALHSENLILCHGYPSLLLIYSKIYKITNDSIYNKASKQYEQQCKQAISDSYFEYRKNRVPHYFFDKSSLLIGYSGFILSALFWEGYNDCDWSKCLLL